MDKDNANPDEIPLLPKTCTIGLIVCVCAFFSTVLTLVWLLVPASAFPFSKTSVIGYTVINLSRLILCLLLPVIVFTKMFRIPETKILGTNPGMGAFLLSLLIGCPASLMFVSLHNLLLRLFLVKGLSLAQPAFSFVSDDASIESRMLVFAVVFLIPILLQELFFRGFYGRCIIRKAVRGEKFGIFGFRCSTCIFDGRDIIFIRTRMVLMSGQINTILYTDYAFGNLP